MHHYSPSKAMQLRKDARKVVKPLHHGAFIGDVQTMRALMHEIPDTWPDNVKSKFLDSTTALDYSPLMLACKCHHIEVAQILNEKGCNAANRNSSGKTGKMLLEEVQREVELSLVHPWSRGDQLHLGAESPEAFLEMAKDELNEHVHAGMKVWYSKQMVWNFDLEQMKALVTQIEQLVRS